MKNILYAYKLPGFVLSCIFFTCCSIYEYPSPCPQGQVIQYVYDKTMSGGNAFGAQVGYIALYIFDENGDYVMTLTDEGEALNDNNYVMNASLASGVYSFVTWSRASAEMSSFDLLGLSRIEDLNKEIVNTQNGISDAYLYPLWHGNMLDVTVANEGEHYTINLTKNTNNIRVILQQIDGTSVNPSLFDFTIFDNARKLSGIENEASGDIIYILHITGPSTVGSNDNKSSGVTVAYAAFSTSLLFAGHNTRSLINRKNSDLNVLDIPLIDYLTMRSEIYSIWSDQEYLDREVNYTLVLFLDHNNQWVSSTIIVNDWIVRINDGIL